MEYWDRRYGKFYLFDIYSMIQITESPVRQYGFTLRKTKLDKPVTREMYESHLQKMETYLTYVTVTKVIYEETGGLHCHGIMKIDKQFPLFRLRTRGFKLYLEELYDVEQWERYLNKDQNTIQPEDVEPPPESCSPLPKGRLFKK